MAEGWPGPHASPMHALPWVCSNEDVIISSAPHYLCEVPSRLARVGHQAAVVSCSGPKLTQTAKYCPLCCGQSLIGIAYRRGDCSMQL